MVLSLWMCSTPPLDQLFPLEHLKETKTKKSTNAPLPQNKKQQKTTHGEMSSLVSSDLHNPEYMHVAVTLARKVVFED